MASPGFEIDVGERNSRRSVKSCEQSVCENYDEDENNDDDDENNDDGDKINDDDDEKNDDDDENNDDDEDDDIDVGASNTVSSNLFQRIKVI